MKKRLKKNLLLAFAAALGLVSTAMGQGGVYTAIDFPGASQTLAWGINKARDIVGSYTIAGVTHAFKLTGDRFTTIDYPGATTTDARGTNNRGDISGLYQGADGVFHGFLLSGDLFTSLDFPSATLTQGWGVSPSGEVVGTYTIGGVSHDSSGPGINMSRLILPGRHPRLRQESMPPVRSPGFV